MSHGLIKNYPHQIGGHCGSGAMRDLLHWHGLGWGRPPAEGLVFALGGDLGLSYLRSDGLVPPVYLVGRGADFEIDLPRRLGGQVEVLTTDDPRQGWSWVRDEIDAGRPTLVWGDIAELPYLKVQLQMSRHDIVVIGYDESEGTVTVVDNDRADVQEIPFEALARARSSTSFPQPTRHCTFRITWPDRLPDIATVAAEAFAQSAVSMRHPTRPGIADLAEAQEQGLVAVDRLVQDVRGWVDLPVYDLEILLFSLSMFIEKAGTGGGLFRRLLADGCEEVARLTGNEATANLAAAAGRCAQVWTETACACRDRGVDAQVRAARVATTVSQLPALESALVDALEAASRSLVATDHAGGSMWTEQHSARRTPSE
ncbi:MAG: BtrH N-terminal domain-containing protein [Rhodococcus sp. (in: high G+C Gram-positive bacteria)]